MRPGKTFLAKSVRPLISGLLVALVLLLNLLAVAPSLHKLIHSDAGESGHQCAVTLFAHGQVDSASADVAAVVPAVSVEISSQFCFSVFTPAIKNLPAGRAPPVFVSPAI